MALFTVRDRIAIAVLSGIILTGWGIRLYLHQNPEEPVRVIRGAVQTPTLSTAPVAVSDSAAASSSSVPAPDSTRLVDINLAGASELDKLPMIGPAKAEAIIRYRVEHGPFARPADIQNVKGIGPAIYSRIEKRITVKEGAGKAGR